MKKRKLTLAILAMVVATLVSVAIVSCKKEKQERPTNNMEQTVQSADDMDEYLVSFKKKMLSAEKGEEIIDFKQAEQVLGNLLNFDFGDANYVTNQLQRDTFHIVLNTIRETVDLSQLAKTYKEAYYRILETFQKIDFEEKSVLYVTCSINKDAKDDDTADVQLILVTRGLKPTSLKTNIDSTDNWRV